MRHNKHKDVIIDLVPVMTERGIVFRMQPEPEYTAHIDPRVSDYLDALRKLSEAMKK